MKWKMAACLLASLAGIAEAAEVQPGIVIREFVPGKKEVVQLTLRTQRAVEKVVLQPVDFVIDRKGSVSIRELKDKRNSGKSWCKLEPTEMILRQGKDSVIDVTFELPSGTPGGEYYMGLQIQTGEKGAAKQENMKVQMEVNLMVMVVMTVKGSAPRVAAELIEPSVTVKDSIPQFTAAFHSLSSVSVVARSAVIVRDSESKIIDKTILMGAGSQQEDGQAFVMPDGLRDFTGQGNRKLPAGKYSAEIFSIFGIKHVRAAITVEFEVVKSDAPEVSPIEDVLVSPSKIVLEMAAGSVKFQIVELKNRGFNAVKIKLATEAAGVSLFPDVAELEPGKSVKIRIGIRLPATDDPRRDVAIRLSLEGGADTDQKTFTISIYAPGTVPKEK